MRSVYDWIIGSTSPVIVSMLRACCVCWAIDRATATSVVLLPFREFRDRVPVPECVRNSLPFFDRDRILLLDSVSVPFWNYIERAERNDSLVWSHVVDVAAHQPLLVVVVLVLEVHHSKEHCLLVEFSQRFVVVLHERIEQQP